MKKVMLIQSRLQAARAAQECEEFKHALPSHVRLECVSALDTARAWEDPARFLEGYDAVFIGGSGDFHLHGGSPSEDDARQSAQHILERLQPLVTYMLSKDISLLGICFGHQLIAEISGGDVTHDHAQKKTGTYEVRLTEEGKTDRLFAGMPESFPVQYAHKDSVTSLPK